eukprot:359406-Chlamydomonas_euryale.AAC.3
MRPQLRELFDMSLALNGGRLIVHGAVGLAILTALCMPGALRQMGACAMSVGCKHPAAVGQPIWIIHLPVR